MANDAYSWLDSLLHRLALGSCAVAEASFSVEQITQRPDSSTIIDQPHVFISGLARAGTTVLMRRFHATGCFRSLIYRDMPFVLMPNLWAKLSAGSRKNIAAHERAHGDGIYVNYDSPEALEEVFWRVYAGNDYIRKDCLVPMAANAETIEKFRLYVADILAPTGPNKSKRYLSKNNNNILRLTSIHRAFPNAILIVPFRDPLQQAHSLLRQHLRFSEEKDRFTRHYMGWLVHHEFGADHRPFNWPGESAHYHTHNDINHWLELWLHTYRWIHTHAPTGTIFLGYETFCDNLDVVWPALAAKAQIPHSTEQTDVILRRVSNVEAKIDKALLLAANELHGALDFASRNGLESGNIPPITPLQSGLPTHHRAGKAHPCSADQTG